MLNINKVLGLVFANMHDATVTDLTKERAFGSVLFGGRYRMIDFPLSNLVNSGVSEVGIVTKANYQSLLDHLGSGREWDLSRKKGGLHLLPPFANVGSGMYRGRLEALAGVKSFVEHSHADYVILTDCDIITTLNYNAALDQHIASKADITCIYANTDYDCDINKNVTVFSMDDDKKIVDITLSPQIKGRLSLSLDMFILSKDFLMKLIETSISRNLYSFIRDILQPFVKGGYEENFKVMGYQHTGYFLKIESMQSYYNANMAILDTENRSALFKTKAPIYTKSSDYGPVKYGMNANVKNSLIADGTIIEGEVTNSVVFRGCRVAKGAKIKDCILMQGTVIHKNSILEAVITDKNVNIGEGKVLTVSKDNPLYIGKNAIV
jgi:glucose-1-phosphate adenylyltransferase